MQCDKCGRTAVIRQRYSGLHLCDRHFILDFEAKAKRAIRRHGWLCRNDHIAVVFSINDGSRALLHFLEKLTGGRRDVTLSAIVVHDGDCRVPARSTVPSGIPCRTVSVTAESGFPPAALTQDSGGADIAVPLLEQALLHRTARRHGITKLATAACLDDEAAHVLAQVLLGTPGRLLRLPPKAAPVVPEIRPFLYASREEISLYSRLTTGTAVQDTGDRAPDAFSADVRSFLEEYGLRHPSVPYSLVSLKEQLTGEGMPMQEDVQLCPRCGEPFINSCRVCRILDGVSTHAR